MTTNNDTPNVNYEYFQFYLGMAGDYFTSLQASYSNSPWVTAAERAAVGSALNWLSRATLNPALYYSAYQSDGWTGLADQALSSGVTNFFVSQSAAWGTAGALALGMSGGAAFMVGLGAGVAVGAGAALTVNWATGGSLVGSLSGLIDYVSDYNTAHKGGTILPDGSILLDEIVINSSGDFAILSQAQKLIADLFKGVDQFNFVYNKFGIDLDIDDLLNTDYSQWIQKFEQGIGDKFGDPNLRIPESEMGLGSGVAIAQSVQKLAKLYKDNPQAFSGIPGFGQKIMNAAQAAGAFLQALIDRISPLVIDLNGDGIETISILDSEAEFDFGNGNEIAHGWLSPNDGFLALDKNDNGIIDGITELFGSKERDGFTLLSEYDENKDGIINANDSVFSQLLVWRDLNGNGQSDEGEIQSLSELGISSINLTPSLQDEYNSDNWLPLSSSIEMVDGTTREIADVYFSRIKATFDEPVDVKSDSYVIMGGSASDHLEGDQKDQIFIGGRGSDTFVFTGDSGNDIILDFEPDGLSADFIDLTQTNIDDYTNLLTRITQDGADTVITIDQWSSVRLTGVESNGLSAQNFILG